MKDALRNLLLILGSVAAALGMVLSLLWLAGFPPAAVLANTGINPLAWIRSPLQPANLRNMCVILATTCPLLLTGLAAGIAFRCGVFNIGAEGQAIIGAIAATTLVTLVCPTAAGWPVIFLALLCAATAGALWATLAAALARYRGVPIVLSTILLNFIAASLLAMSVKSWLHNPGTGDPQSYPVPAALRLPALVLSTNLNVGIFIAVTIALGSWIVQARTTFGFELLVTGLNPHAARVAGIPVPARQMGVMALSGAFAGTAGAIQLLGVTHVLNATLTPYGYAGIAVALLGRLHPLGIVAAALFFATLDRAASNLELNLSIPHDVSDIIKGIVILAMLVGTAYLARQRIRLRQKEGA